MGCGWIVAWRVRGFDFFFFSLFNLALPKSIWFKSRNGYTGYGLGNSLCVFTIRTGDKTGRRKASIRKNLMTSLFCRSIVYVCSCNVTICTSRWSPTGRPKRHQNWQDLKLCIAHVGLRTRWPRQGLGNRSTGKEKSTRLRSSYASAMTQQTQESYRVFLVDGNSLL